jgi:uridine kinase
MKSKPLLVAIVGGSGSGKSWLCRNLCAALGKRAGRLSLDDFYRDRSILPEGRRARLNFDHPRAIDWAAFEQVLKDCLAGRKTKIPQYDFRTHTRRRRPRIIRPQPVIFVDGLWLLNVARIRVLFGLAIYLHCPAKTRLKRRLARDLVNRGRSADSVREQFRRTVEPMHQRFVEPQARRAHLVIRRTVQQRDIKAVLQLLQNVTNMLKSTP